MFTGMPTKNSEYATEYYYKLLVVCLEHMQVISGRHYYLNISLIDVGICEMKTM